MEWQNYGGDKIKLKKIAALLIILCGFGISAVFSNNTQISVDYQFRLIRIGDAGDTWIENTILQEIEGEPLIPYYPASILLPQGTEVKDITVDTTTPIVQKGIEIQWGQPPCTFSDTPKEEKVKRNEKIYTSDDLYPGTLYEVMGVDSFRGYNILNIHLFPLQYQPKSSMIHFYEKFTVNVELKSGPVDELYRGLEDDRNDVALIVDNPADLDMYSEKREITPIQPKEYIIITSSTLESTFQTLADHKAAFVNGAAVYKTNWIYSSYPGDDNQEKIRNFIKYMYINRSTKYVLLGGDTSIVPYRGFYVTAGSHTDYDMAADMYYAHLNGSFDNDGDGKYAEPGEVDWYAEVAVGRAPVDNISEAEAFVDKVIAYEKASKPTRICFHQSRVRPDNSPDSRCFAWNCDNYVPSGWTIDYLFEEDGTVTKADWRNAWSAGPIAVFHIGHGSPTGYDINMEVCGKKEPPDSEDSEPCPIYWNNTDMSSLTNTFFPWTTSVTCLSGQFEANDCLAEEYVKDDNGAIGAIYNDNYGWFSLSNACKYSGEFCEMESKAFFLNGKEKLGDMLNIARSYMVSSAQSSSAYRWCFYERNLIGDPESPCLTKRWPPFPPFPPCPPALVEFSPI